MKRRANRRPDPSRRRVLPSRPLNGLLRPRPAGPEHPDAGEQMASRVIVLLLLAGLLASPVAAQTVFDGDTIKLNGMTWRLWGIDAPELHQSCADSWQAGVEAKRALERLMAVGPVQCEDRGRDRYGRSIGLYRAGGKDLGTDMVAAGMAWAFTRYSSD